MLLTTSSKQL